MPETKKKEWRIIQVTNNELGIAPKDSEVLICTICSEQVGGTYYPSEEDEENANLIVNAPQTKEERDKLLVGIKEAKEIILTTGFYKEDSVGLLGINNLIKEME